MGTVPDITATIPGPPAVAAPKLDDDTKVTEFHLTGFSRFHNVPINPTQLIVEAIPGFLSKRPLKPGAVLASTNVMKVAAETTRTDVEQMYKQLDKPTHPLLRARVRSDRRIVFIHMGVNMRVSHFQLELQGRNEATFSCPDELGWTPIKRPIDKNNFDISTVCRTTLPLERLVEDLKQKGFGVEMSTDAGRFVCNWVYYNSLQLAKKNDTSSLFVHVPPATVYPIEKQVEFMAALLDSIVSLP